MRTLMILAGLLALLPIGAATAQSPYLLEPGDSVEIWVAQGGELNRVTSLGPDGRLSLPLVGEVDAAGMSLQELQDVLVGKLQQFYTEPLNISVMLQPNDAHLPMIVVAGEVDEPGIYPYRSGMTVLHAVAVAGGPYRTALLISDQDRSMVLESTLATDQRRLNELTVTILRLNAELTGSNELNLPPDVAGDDVAAIVERQQAILDLEIQETNSAQAASERLKDISQRTIDAIEAQIASIESRMTIAEGRLATATTLVERGVMQSSQRQDIEATIVDMEGIKSQLQGQLASQEGVILTEQSRLESLVQTRRVELLAELSAAESEHRALTATIADGETVLSLYQAQGVTQDGFAYRIVRSTDGAVEEIEATEQTLLQAGDLVKVLRAGSVPAAPAPVEPASGG